MPRRLFDHIDLRVPQGVDAAPFYEALLPELGFTRKVEDPGWLQYEAGDEETGAFFGLTESARFVANENRIAFWVESEAEVVRLAEVAVTAGAIHVEGPMLYEAGYHAVFFEDPFGNRFEICHRHRVSSEQTLLKETS